MIFVKKNTKNLRNIKNPLDGFVFKSSDYCNIYIILIVKISLTKNQAHLSQQKLNAQQHYKNSLFT